MLHQKYSTQGKNVALISPNLVLASESHSVLKLEGFLKLQVALGKTVGQMNVMECKIVALEMHFLSQTNPGGFPSFINVGVSNCTGRY